MNDMFYIWIWWIYILVHVVSILSGTPVYQITRCNDDQFDVIMCPISKTSVRIKRAGYLIHSGSKCQYTYGDSGKRVTDEYMYEIQNKCENKRACVDLIARKKNDIFLLYDSQYVMLEYTCEFDQNILEAYGSVNETFNNLECSNGSIDVLNVFYGYTNLSTQHYDSCFSGARYDDCITNVEEEYFNDIRSECNGNATCLNVTATCPSSRTARCDDVTQTCAYVMVVYRCEDTTNTDVSKYPYDVTSTTIGTYTTVDKQQSTSSFVGQTTLETPCVTESSHNQSVAMIAIGTSLGVIILILLGIIGYLVLEKKSHTKGTVSGSLYNTESHLTKPENFQTHPKNDVGLDSGDSEVLYANQTLVAEKKAYGNETILEDNVMYISADSKPKLGKSSSEDYELELVDNTVYSSQ